MPDEQKPVPNFLAPANNAPTLNIPRSLMAVLGDVNEGDFHKDANGEFVDFCAELEMLSDRRGKALVKGKFTITLEVEAKEGVLQIRPEFAVKVPKLPRGATIFWRDRTGLLTRSDPKQHDLPLHVVTDKSGPARSAY